MQTNIETLNKQGLSFVIGSRDEFPTVAMTISALMEECLFTGLERFEFILMDNGSTDETSKFFAWKPTNKTGHWDYTYSPRGMVAEDRLRIFFDPVLSNVGTRNKGVHHAKYENIIFADAHILVRRKTVLYTLDALNRFGGIIHCPVSWMGSDGKNPSPSYQYSYKVGEKIWGTWNRACPVPDKPFYIPLSGHCWLAVKRDEFLEKRGYPYAQRVYGGGEPYLDTKFWMTGSTSMTDPRGLVYHLSAGRNYSWNNSDLIHNMFLVSHILGGEEWSDRILITYYNKSGVHKGYIKQLHDEAVIEAKEDKEWLDNNKIMTFEELLRLDWENDCDVCTKRGSPDPHPMRIWDKKNDELHGNHRSFVAEFKLRKDNGKVKIGNTVIQDEDALKIASKYI